MELFTANNKNSTNQNEAIKNHLIRLFIKIERPEAYIFSFSKAKYQGIEDSTTTIIKYNTSICSLLLVCDNLFSIFNGVSYFFIANLFFFLKPNLYP